MPPHDFHILHFFPFLLTFPFGACRFSKISHLFFHPTLFHNLFRKYGKLSYPILACRELMQITVVEYIDDPVRNKQNIRQF